MKNLIATEYKFRDEWNDMHNLNPVKIIRMKSPFYEGEKWAVRKLNFCLNSKDEWEFEPMPSQRNDDFYRRCRFDTFEEAYSRAVEVRKKENERQS